MESGLDLDSINAPQYFDFTEPAEDADGLENYFDYDHENNTPLVMSDSGNSSMYLDANDSSSSQTDNAYTKNTPKSRVLRSMNKEQNKSDSSSNQPSDQPVKDNKPSNICASLSAWRKRTKPANEPEVRRSPRLQSGRTTVEENKRSHASPALRQARRSAAAVTGGETKPRQLSKSPQKRTHHARTRSVDNKKQPRDGPPEPPKLQRSNSVKLLNRKKNPSLERPKKSTTPTNDTRTRQITPGKTNLDIPSMLRKEKRTVSPGVGKGKSTEEMEMEKIREFQKLLAQKRKAHENYRQKALAPKGPVRHVPSLKAPTKIEEFNFKSDSRVKSQERRSYDKDPKDFKEKLRSASPEAGKNQSLPKKTVPHPFSFDKKRKRPSDQLTSLEEGDKPTKFVPMAEQIKKFNSTPDRFRSQPTNKAPSPAKRRRRSMSQPNIKLTVAHTPNFQTKSRLRPVSVKSQAEKEEEELAEMQKNQFRAKPVNERIFENSCLGVKKVEPKKTTVVEEFDLETNRKSNNSRNKSQEEEHYEFHAKPVPKGILEGPTGIKPAKVNPVTMPESPAFALKNRLRSAIKVPEALPEEKAKPVKAKPAPHHGLPYLPKFEKKFTEVEPFSFEERNKRIHQQTQEKLKRIQEEENKSTDFHAKPVPDHTAPLPPKHTKPRTTPMPFNLEVDARGAMKAEEWSNKIKEELKEQRSKANFKAQPNRATREMFIPKPSTKPLTVLQDVTLNTDVRAVGREQFEQWKHDKQMEQEELRHQREEEQRKQDQEDLERMRREMVTQAQPIRKYKPVQTKPSGMPLTRPQTPKFSERLSKRSIQS